MKTTRYYVLDAVKQIFVGGVKARTPEEAQEMAKYFGLNCMAVKMTCVPGYSSKTVEWSDGSFWVKETRNGGVHTCQCCFKSTVGHGSYSHYRHCPMKVTA